MKFSMTGQEKGDLLIQGDCLIEVTAWAGLTVLHFPLVKFSIFSLYICLLIE